MGEGLGAALQRSSLVRSLVVLLINYTFVDRVLTSSSHHLISQAGWTNVILLYIHLSSLLHSCWSGWQPL